MLQKISISEYKGFFTEQSCKFAIPNNANNGSGLTIIAGPNNTGKTSIIESLLLNQEKKFRESERHGNIPPVITITSTLGVSTTFSNTDGGSSINIVAGELHGINFEFIPSRRQWNYMAGGNFSDEHFFNDSKRLEVRNSSGGETASLLKAINKDLAKKTKLNQMIAKIIPHFTSRTIDTNDSSDYVKYITGNTSHQANFLGDGIISIFRICAHIINNNTSTLIIDEPELSLHPSAQKALSKIISETAKTRQIIVCTHSPYFISREDFRNGANIIRLNKHSDIECTIHQLDATKNYGLFIGNNILERQKPQLLDIAAKEIIFSDRMLFCEGQEDGGLIKKRCAENNKELNFEIFGYGVASYTNIKLFLEMAQDLGLQKAAALYDNGPDSNKAFEENKLIFTNYKLQILSTDDIRDKPTKDKHGIFDEHGEIHDEKIAEFTKIIENFKEYFSS